MPRLARSHCPTCGKYVVGWGGCYGHEKCLLSGEGRGVIWNSVGCVHLPGKSVRLFKCLVPGFITTHETIMDEVYPVTGPQPGTGYKCITVMIYNLRKVLAPLGIGIVSHPCIGYEIVPDVSHKLTKKLAA